MGVLPIVWVEDERTRCLRRLTSRRSQLATLPGDERQTADACLRQVDFLTEEIAAVDRHVAAAGLDSPEIKRLMTIPGVDVTTAATLMAAIGGRLGCDQVTRAAASVLPVHRSLAAGRRSRSSPSLARSPPCPGSYSQSVRTTRSSANRSSTRSATSRPVLAYAN